MIEFRNTIAYKTFKNTLDIIFVLPARKNIMESCIEILHSNNKKCKNLENKSFGVSKFNKNSRLNWKLF